MPKIELTCTFRISVSGDLSLFEQQSVAKNFLEMALGETLAEYPEIKMLGEPEVALGSF